MEFDVLGDPDGGPSLRLDHERFAYAGKFVMSNTGKVIVEDDGEVIAAAAFNRDRTDVDVAWIRYVSVRADRRGDGVGTTLLAHTAEHLLGEHEHVRIAVNNPFAYEACYKAGFEYTGDRTGLAEVVLVRPGDGSGGTYLEGLDAFRERDDLSPPERSFVDAKRDRGPPERVTE